MIDHLVLLKPKADLPARDRQALVAAFERAVREIPTVRAVRLGRRVRLGAGYERAASEQVEFLAVVTFDNLAGLKTYLEHPSHVELGAQFHRSLESAQVYDFELGDLEELAAEPKG